MPGPIDLHTHSSVSDGTETPDTVVSSAIAAGLSGMALTDHDSTAGWSAAAAAASGSDLVLLGGMELSTRHEGRSVHLLAYLFDPEDEALKAETARIRESRLRRAEAMVERISVDYPIDWAAVLAQTSDGATVGRPHIADALVALGIVENRSQAFAQLLHPRGGYFQAHYAPDPLTAVALVRSAGGVPVLAHPATRGPENVISAEHVARLVDAGLFGLEVGHRENTEAGKLRLYELAEQFGLAVTGSSDYHGAGKPNRLGENSTDQAVLSQIIAQGTGSRPLN